MFCADAISPIANRVIRKLEESGRIGKVEGGRKTITRKSDDLVTILDIQAEKVSDVPVNLNTIESMSFQVDGEPLDVQKSDTFIADEGDVAVLFWGDDYSNPFIVSIFADVPDVGEKGTYIPVYKNKDGVTSCCMQFTYNDETITPIDPKYLPSVCLSVVELSEGINPIKVAMGAQQFTADDCAALDAAAKKGMPIIIKISADGILAMYLGSFCVEDGQYMFIIALGGSAIIITGKGDTWAVQYAS